MVSYFIEDNNGNLLIPSYYVGEFLKTTIEKGCGKYVGENGRQVLEDEISNLSVYRRKTEGLRVVGYKNVFIKEM